MTRVTSGFQILIAAVIAVVAALIALFIFPQADMAIISFFGLATFLSGVLTPWLAGMKETQHPPKRAEKSTPSGVSGPSITLYVGNLPFKTSEDSVEDAFSQYGEVHAVRLVKDRRTGKRKGYGFVEMEVAGGQLALEKLNDSDFEGRTLKVREANSERKD